MLEERTPRVPEHPKQTGSKTDGQRDKSIAESATNAVLPMAHRRWANVSAGVSKVVGSCYATDGSRVGRALRSPSGGFSKGAQSALSSLILGAITRDGHPG